MEPTSDPSYHPSYPIKHPGPLNFTDFHRFYTHPIPLNRSNWMNIHLSLGFLCKGLWVIWFSYFRMAPRGGLSKPRSSITSKVASSHLQLNEYLVDSPSQTQFKQTFGSLQYTDDQQIIWACHQLFNVYSCQKYPTINVVLLQRKTNGYTEISWDESKGSLRPLALAFLFSLML